VHPAILQPPFSLAPVRAEFCCDATEQDFLRHHLAVTQSQLRVTFLFCAVFYVGLAVNDAAWLGYGQTTLLLLGARLLVAAIAIAGLLLARRHPQSVRLARGVSSVIETLGCAGFLLVVALRPHDMRLHAIAMAVVIIVLYIYIPNRLLLALTHLFAYVAARRYQLLWREEYSAQVVLKNLSIRDHLTGCYNRRHLHAQLLENEIARAQRYGQSLSVIMCDLDHFKDINDTHGHHGGDAVLQVFAGLLQSMTRDSIDSVVRYGGEEFLLILPATDLCGGVLLAERLRLAFAATPIPHEQQLIAATASFGVASVDFSGSVSAAAQQRMIASADDLLYAAKKGGRNQVCSRQLA